MKRIYRSPVKHFRIPRLGRAFGITAALVCALTWSVSATEHLIDNETADHPLVTAVYVDTPPTLDGILDEDIWNAAARMDDFYSGDLNRRPTERTVMWLAYDDSCIYWAARLTESELDKLHMEQTRRGGRLWSDDNVSIEFDIEHQHRHEGEYKFIVNPRGVQDERVPDGAASKVEWRGDWHCATNIDSTGWTVEAAIPLKLFRAPEGLRTIGVSAGRWHPRTSEWASWPNMGDKWDRTKSGDWVGIKWPKIETRPQFMPYVVSERTNKTSGYVGADAKYVTPGGVTYVATVYPDFQNVENDILGLDFSYSQQYRDDNRPFFAEGDGYLPESWMFYTNNVGEMYTGAKVFGQSGNHRLGLISVYDRLKVSHSAGRWYWQPIQRLEIENKFVWRHGPASAVDKDDAPLVRDNFVYTSVIKRGKAAGKGSSYKRVQASISRSNGVGTNGWNLESSFERNSGSGELGGFLRGRAFSPGFATIDGILGIDEADQRDIQARVWMWKENDQRLFKSYGFNTGGRHATRFNGDLYVRDNSFEVWCSVVSGSGFWIEYKDGERPPNRDQTINGGIWWLENTLHYSGYVGYRYGRLGGADYGQVNFNQGFRLIENLSTDVRLSYRRRDLPVGHDDLPDDGDYPDGMIEHQHQSMLTAQYDLTTERAISGRVIRTHDGWNGYVTFQQVVRKGMDLFLIVGDPSEDTWQNRIALKAMIVM
jgi:hypothetical protein